MLITMAIMGIISLVLGQMYFQGYRTWRQNKARIDVQGDARRMLYLINRDLRQAQAGTIVISRYPDEGSTDNPPCSKISFYHINGSSYSYYQDGLKIYRFNNGAAHQLGENVRVLSFATMESNDDASVNIGLCLEEKTYAEKSKTSKLSVQIVRVMN